MRKYIFFYCLFLSQFAFAQSMDFSRVVPPEGQTPRTFEDQLVQWAWFNSPGNLVYKRQIEIAAKKVKMTWWEWLKDANATFNLNEIHFTQATSTTELNNLFFPRYNFGLNFNLGEIVSRPGRTKIAKEEMKIVELEEQQQMLKVRSEVLQRYQDYELSLEIYKFKTQAAEEAESVYTLVLEQFENDKVDFKDFTAASSNFHGANEAKAMAKTQVTKTKIALEELIGIPWDKAVKRRRKR